MALFGRENEDNIPTRPASAPVRQPASRPARKTTLIAAGAKLVGEVSGDTDVMIEGTVEGTVNPSSDVTVGDEGLVVGKIDAQRVRIAGKVKGNVRGKESVEILSSGSLEGDVSSPGMVIGDGAFFKGRVEMTTETPAAPEPAKAPAKEESKPKPTGTPLATGAAPSSTPARS